MKVLLFCKAAAARIGTTQRLRERVSHPNVPLSAMIVFYALAVFAAVVLATIGNQDSIGYLASLFVLGSFSSQTMVSLRALALMSNVAFMAYAYASHLLPVLLLHALLLPVNALRLWQHLRGQKQPRRDGRYEPTTRGRLDDERLTTAKM